MLNEPGKASKGPNLFVVSLDTNFRVYNITKDFKRLSLILVKQYFSELKKTGRNILFNYYSYI